MGKPTISIDNIKWANLDRFDPTSGQANKAVPSTDKINYGWESSETPPMQYFNYWQNLVYQYINWLASDRNDTIFLNGATSDATETELFIDGVDEDRLEIADNSNILFDCLVNAFSIGDRQSKTLRISGEIQRIGTPVLIKQNKEELSQVAYDVSNAVYESEYFSVSSQDTIPTGISFNSDGSKMFIIGSYTDTVYAYGLSTNFDVSTAVYSSEYFDVSSQEASPAGISFNSDGSKMFIIGTANDTVYAYDLSTNFDVSTAVYSSEYFDVSSQEAGPEGLTFNSDGSKMFIIGDTVFAYDTQLPWDINLEADTTNNALVAKVTGAASTNINWKVRLEKIENS